MPCDSQVLPLIISTILAAAEPLRCFQVMRDSCCAYLSVQVSAICDKLSDNVSMIVGHSIMQGCAAIPITLVHISAYCYEVLHCF